MAKIGIIGGTGVYNLALVQNREERTVLTAYGDVTLVEGSLGRHQVVFLPRHGKDHALPPHRINYRANILALKEAGVERVVATAASGSLRENLRPGEMVLLDQFLDFTKSRPQTFWEGGDQGVFHVDLTEPYCSHLRSWLQQAAAKADLTLHDQATYVCTEGPRFETPAEIRMFSILGGDLVGMTGVPEVVLAREAGLCYACIGLITNYAAGLAGKPLTHQEVLDSMAANNRALERLLEEFLSFIPETRDCHCPKALEELGSLKGEG